MSLVLSIGSATPPVVNQGYDGIRKPWETEMGLISRKERWTLVDTYTIYLRKLFGRMATSLSATCTPPQQVISNRITPTLSKDVCISIITKPGLFVVQ